jgi:MarR family transcriptional regulator, temperature-dependent positive regulator of motility
MSLFEMPGHLIRRLNQISTNVFQREMKKAGIDLTQVQFAALQSVFEAPGIDQAGVAANIAYDRATIGGVIDRLEQKGLVTRIVSPRDKRAREVRLTSAGTQLFKDVLPIVRSIQGEILSGLSGAEKEVFLTLATKAVKQATAEV